MRDLVPGRPFVATREEEDEEEEEEEEEEGRAPWHGSSASCAAGAKTLDTKLN